MAKRVRRVRRRAAKKDKSNPPTTEVETAAANNVSFQKAEVPEEELALEQEYAYVMQDLRRVFILAAVLFVLLIALNLLLG